MLVTYIPTTRLKVDALLFTGMLGPASSEETHQRKGSGDLMHGESVSLMRHSSYQHVATSKQNLITGWWIVVIYPDTLKLTSKNENPGRYTIHPASRGVAAHTACLFRSVRGAKGGFPPRGLPKLGNFHFSPPWGLPKLGNFHFSPRGGSSS